jgi:hypothetical protein
MGIAETSVGVRIRKAGPPDTMGISMPLAPGRAAERDAVASGQEPASLATAQ